MGGTSRLVRAVSAVVLAAALGALAACGSSGSGSQGSGTGTVKMVLWPGPEGDAMAKVVSAYNAGQGKTDKIHIDMTLLSRSDTFSKEATLMATKSSEFDVYFTASYLVAQHAPYLQPLQGLDASRYFPSAVQSLQVEGKQYALPLDISNNFLYYRTDLINKLRTDPTWQASYARISQQLVGQSLTPKDPADWTWNDFIATAAFFTKKENPQSPTTYGTALQAKNLLFNTMIWDDVLWSFGGGWLDSSGKPALDSTAAHQAMQVYNTIYTKALTSPDSSQAEFPETQAAMTSGNAAMAIQWSAGYADLNNPTKSPTTAGKVGVAPVPGDKHQTHVHALAVAINNYGKNRSAAQKWISYLETPQAMTLYAKSGGIPAQPGVLSSLTSVNPVYTFIARDLSADGFSEPALPKTYDIYSALAQDLSGAWVGQQSIDAALKKADSDLGTLAAQKSGNK
ncbi:extracellular solute-binding protein [Rugosimonospora africana]|uniref:ABC transporter substrate-binding protein n=1 Tax=Rugosimonospora africana TaxID=556532 RepID=A0A8J3QYV2_9ACTN|nr:extracellular solute-binding protein [Rugosimonospora africana]GIH17166.1 ABC transporter substrate-binding protein [Rugosimonospora africana]